MDDKFQVFNNPEFGSLELLLEDDKIYFPATKCAEILGYTNPRDAIIRHCKGVVIHDSLTDGGMQKIRYIPEGDLYRLIIRSKLPAAENFEHWVFDEVLPTIRKYGMYVTDNLLEQMIAKPELVNKVIEEIKSDRSKHIALEKENRHNKALISLMKCKVSYHDKILKSTNTIPISKIAKDYGMTAIALNQLLHEERIQYPLSDTWLLYKDYADKGYTQSYTYYITKEKTVVHTHWTQKGRLFLYKYLKSIGIIPISERMEAIQ
jgi:prophage antirepressor-like protein